jgi:hypothetical protein
VRYPDWSARGDLIVFERAEMTGKHLATRSGSLNCGKHAGRG